MENYVQCPIEFGMANEIKLMKWWKIMSNAQWNLELTNGKLWIFNNILSVATDI